MYILGNSPNPATDGLAVTPSDDTVFAPTTRWVYVGGAGDLVVTTEEGTDLTFKAVPAGTTLRIRVKKVKAASTATFILALW